MEPRLLCGYLPQDPPLDENKTVKENVMEGVQKIYDALDAADVRVELDNRAEKLGYRMREGQVQKYHTFLLSV